MTAVLLLSTYFSNNVYTPPGIVPNAAIRSVSSAHIPSRVFLTPSKQNECNQCSVFRLETLDKWCYGEEVENHVKEAPM